MRVGICFDTGCSGRFAGIIRRLSMGRGTESYLMLICT